MFKARLRPGDDLDRMIEAAGKALSRLANAALEAGLLRIVAYPAADPVAAASVAAAILARRGVRVSLSVSVRPPPVVAPTLALGYESANYKQKEVLYEVVVIGSGEVRGTAFPGLTILEAEGSVTAAVTLALSQAERLFAGDEALLALAASMLGRYVEEQGKFHGLDRVLLEEIMRLFAGGLTYYTGIKAYKPNRYTVCRSLSRSANPFYPRIAGDEDYCKRLLEGMGLGEIAGKTLASLNKEELESLYDVLEGEVLQEVEEPFRYYLGGFPMVTGEAARIEDVREASDTLVYVADKAGLEGLAALAVDLENEYSPSEYSLESYVYRLSEVYERSKPRRVKLQAPLKVYVIDELGSDDSLYLTWRALYLTGRVDQDSILAYQQGRDYVASALQVEASQGYGSVKRLVETRRAKLEGLRLWLTGDAQQS